MRSEHGLDNQWALIYGYRGQDGTLLSRSLFSQGINFIGVSKSQIILKKINSQTYYFVKNFALLKLLIKTYKPKEVYYLAAHHSSSENSLPSLAFTNDFSIFQKTNVLEFIQLLELYRTLDLDSSIFYASSAHIFGHTPDTTLSESSPFQPLSFYGMSKAMGIWVAKKYRNDFGMRVYTGILFNHESHLRQSSFLTNKVINTALKIKSGQNHILEIGNLKTEVDWGYAKDFVKAFQLIIRMTSPDDYIISTGTKYSTGAFIKLVFQTLDLDWHDYIVSKPSIIENSLELGLAPPIKLNKATGWTPSLRFEDFVPQLIDDYLTAH